MTLQEVREELDAIKAIMDGKTIGNSEAHEREDELFRRVLRAIAANNCENCSPAELAAEAVKAEQIKYQRWYD